VNPRKSQVANLTPDTRVSFVPMADLNEHRIDFRPSEEKLLSEVSASYTYFENNDVLLAKVTPCFENGKAGIARSLLNGVGFGSSEFYVLRSSAQVLSEWVYFCVMHPLFRDAAVAQMTGTGGLQRVPRAYVENFEIPLPPLDVQKEIVAEIDGYQKVIDGARAVLDNYRPHIPIQPGWPIVRLSDVCETITDGDHLPPPKAAEGVPFVTITNITKDREIDFTNTFFVPESYYAKLNPSRKPRRGDILYTVTGSYGIPVLVKSNARFCFQRHIALIRTGPKVLNSFLYSLLASPFMLQQGDAAATGVAQKTVSLTALRSFNVPLPSLKIQEGIAAEIDVERTLVDANRELIARFEKKIQATLARVWGEDQP
jgi:type I restriction enzyme M protein